MRLFLHFGIYKTGSSYLQHICMVRRGELVEHGICFVRSSNDQRMYEGRISAGNSADLEEMLSSENEHGCQKLLRKWKQEAEEENCAIILISGEALVHQLVKPKSIYLLESASHVVGIKSISALGFFRDLVSHALSTYKHRAKTGRIPDFENWVKYSYETPKLLEDFFLNFRKNSIDWSVRKFYKDSNYLSHCFFEEWLEIPSPKVPGLPSVNESLELSEIILMIELAKAYPLVIDRFVHQFQQISKNEKAKNKWLDKHYQHVAATTLEGWLPTLKEINKHFAPTERLFLIKDFSAIKLNQEAEGELLFSRKQLATLVETLKYFKTWRGRLLQFRRRMLPLIPPPFRKIWKSLKR